MNIHLVQNLVSAPFFPKIALCKDPVYLRQDIYEEKSLYLIIGACRSSKVNNLSLKTKFKNQFLYMNETSWGEPLKKEETEEERKNPRAKKWHKQRSFPIDRNSSSNKKQLKTCMRQDFICKMSLMLWHCHVCTTQKRTWQKWAIPTWN